MPAPRRWRRRALVTLLALVALSGGATWYLLRWRHALAPAPARARVVPPPAHVAGLRACWIETGKLLWNTGSGLLVRHPQGDLLIDTGNSSHFSDEAAPYPLKDRLWLKAVPGVLGPSTPLPDALRAAGADPARLRVLLTHSHVDHAGGVMDLPANVQILVAPPEQERIEKDDGAHARGVIRAHAARLRGHLVPIQFQPHPYEVWDQSADLFGDGSVIVVPLYGHTAGSVGVFVTLPSGKRLFHVGDAAHDWRGLEEGLSEQPLLANTNWDTELAESVLARLTALHKAVPELLFLPAHARRAWAEAFTVPGRCIE